MDERLWSGVCDNMSGCLRLSVCYNQKSLQVTLDLDLDQADGGTLLTMDRWVKEEERTGRTDRGENLIILTKQS